MRTMTKEDSDRITKLEIEQAVQKERDAWHSLIASSIVKTVTWLTGVGIMGAVYGWHLPENIRKYLADWLSK